MIIHNDIQDLLHRWAGLTCT